MDINELKAALQCYQEDKADAKAIGKWHRLAVTAAPELIALVERQEAELAAKETEISNLVEMQPGGALYLPSLPVGYVFGNSYWEVGNPNLTEDIKRLGRPRYADATPQAQPALTVLTGWKINRHEDGIIVVQKDGVGGYTASEDDHNIASSILHALASDLLAVAAPSQCAAPDEQTAFNTWFTAAAMAFKAYDRDYSWKVWQAARASLAAQPAKAEAPDERKPMPLFMFAGLEKELKSNGWSYSGETNVIYSLTDAAQKAGFMKHEHPNLDVPEDTSCSAKLDELGDDRGQGLDGYWKWGFRAGWHHAKLAAPAPAMGEELPPLPKWVAEKPYGGSFNNIGKGLMVGTLHAYGRACMALRQPAPAQPVAAQAPYGWVNAGTERQQTEYATLNVGPDNPWCETANAFPVYTAAPSAPIGEA